MSHKALRQSSRIELKQTLTHLRSQLREDAPNFKAPIQSSIEYLNSQEAVQSLEADPYWPKWNSPWWHMTLLFEMGQTDLIPDQILTIFKSVSASHYLDVFPLREEEIPPGCDTTRNIFCHCALGTALQIFESAGYKADDIVPWVRQWFARYQLDDGGYNCDEAVYLKDTPRSSIVSTLPMLETLLSFGKERLTAADLSILDKGAKYLLARRLFKSLSKQDAVIDEQFLQLTFPRFYDYDILRGLSFVSSHARLLETSINWRDIVEVFRLLESKVINDTLTVERAFFADKTTLAKEPDGEWRRGNQASVFPLLLEVGKVGFPSIFLTRKFATVVENLIGLNERDLIRFE
ncbi:MAG: hypothetical protein IAF58_06340 [Leptolyngbya sp.]|nr:hypothetical protein [Candidatus Melainabacteria bacterium]